MHILDILFEMSKNQHPVSDGKSDRSPPPVQMLEGESWQGFSSDLISEVYKSKQRDNDVIIIEILPAQHSKAKTRSPQVEGCGGSNCKITEMLASTSGSKAFGETLDATSVEETSNSRVGRGPNRVNAPASRNPKARDCLRLCVWNGPICVCSGVVAFAYALLRRLTSA